MLGVPRGADQATIRKAFRSLAREFHPDVSGDPEAAQKFREVAEAYKVLSKPTARRLYDRYRDDGLFGRVAGARSRRPREGVRVEVEVDFLEAARGATREVSFPVVETCMACGGDGSAPGSRAYTCPSCRGSGRLLQVSDLDFVQLFQLDSCSECGGSGRVANESCAECAGGGEVTVERTLEVRIAAGAKNGQTIRLNGADRLGRTDGLAGDVYALIRVQPPPDNRLVRLVAAGGLALAAALLIFLALATTGGSAG